MSDSSVTSCPLFFHLSEKDINEILERCVVETRTVDKGSHVVRQGDTIHSLFLLMEGLVRTEMVTKEGNILEIEFIEPVRPLAPAFLVASENRYPVDVITAENSLLYYSKIVVAQRNDGERDIDDQLHEGEFKHDGFPLKKSANDVDQEHQGKTVALYIRKYDFGEGLVHA